MASTHRKPDPLHRQQRRRSDQEVLIRNSAPRTPRNRREARHQEPRGNGGTISRSRETENQQATARPKYRWAGPHRIRDRFPISVRGTLKIFQKSGVPESLLILAENSPWLVASPSKRTIPIERRAITEPEITSKMRRGQSRRQAVRVRNARYIRSSTKEEEGRRRKHSVKYSAASFCPGIS